MKFLCLVWALFSAVVNSFALDREAFTLTNYDLQVRVEPEQQRLGVRGKIILRNDSSSPQKNAVLQISSSLSWRSVQAAGKPVQFVAQPYRSDIDHTGALSEAVVNLPREVPPKASTELQVAYEGVIVQDTARLTAIGTPKEVAAHTDWDEIGQNFSGVRGVGYVAWYPIATDAAILADGNSVFKTVGRWKKREASAVMNIEVTMSRASTEAPPTVLLNGQRCKALAVEDGAGQIVSTACAFEPLGMAVPEFLVANYSSVESHEATVFYLPGHESGARDFALAADLAALLITEWFGVPREKAEVVEVFDAAAARFESGNMLLSSFADSNAKLAQITMAHQLTHAAFPSSQPWIYEGLAHFAQALYRERQDGREAALDYLGLQRTALIETEKSLREPLDSTFDEILHRSKAAYVWWMLRDMMGDDALKKALAAYRPEQDKEPVYVQHLIEAETKRDLGWFFDDWVYKDRGLPDFRVASAYARKNSQGGYLVTITVEDLGGVGAEVPVTLRMAGGEVTKRLEVRAKSSTVTRIEAASAPQEVMVNDGSVPESDMGNNIFKVERVEP
jgi:hypothetical protein